MLLAVPGFAPASVALLNDSTPSTLVGVLVEQQNTILAFLYKQCWDTAFAIPNRYAVVLTVPAEVFVVVGFVK